MRTTILVAVYVSVCATTMRMEFFDQKYGKPELARSAVETKAKSEKSPLVFPEGLCYHFKTDFMPKINELLANLKEYEGDRKQGLGWVMHFMMTKVGLIQRKFTQFRNQQLALIDFLAEPETQERNRLVKPRSAAVSDTNDDPPQELKFDTFPQVDETKEVEEFEKRVAEKLQGFANVDFDLTDFPEIDPKARDKNKAEPSDSKNAKIGDGFGAKGGKYRRGLQKKGQGKGTEIPSDAKPKGKVDKETEKPSEEKPEQPTSPSVLDIVSNWAVNTKAKQDILTVQENFNYRALGTLFGRLIIWQSYGCLDIPSASLLIFRMFYLRVFSRKGVREFFGGFFGYLNHVGKIRKGKREKKPSYTATYARKSVQLFFGFNLFVLLGTGSELANQLFVLLLEEDPNKDKFELVEQNFAGLYYLVLKLSGLLQGYKENFDENLARGLARFDSHTMKTVTGKGAMLGIMYVVVTFKNFSMAKLVGKLNEEVTKMVGKYDGIFKDSFLKVVKPEKIPELVKSLAYSLVGPHEERLKKYLLQKLPSPEKDSEEYLEELAEEITEKDDKFDPKLLEDIHGHFEKAVVRHYDCAMCRANGLANFAQGQGAYVKRVV